ncbi:hypothetical protein LIER_08713 [Lithospermum erythrorhizon]|uniref:Uncharacterized protein n=1 Tax=Lithospermum erythrorhizon TaxID=34254 RepID=A0AAV3PEC5_LITER
MDEIIQMIQKNSEESVSQNKRLDIQGEKLRATLTAQSSSGIELQGEIEPNRKIEVNGGELKVNVEEPSSYVLTIPFPKRIVGYEVAHDIPGDNSPAEGENEHQLQQIQDFELKQCLYSIFA